MAQYFSVWEKVLYAIHSQPAINNLVAILDVQGAPLLTVSSLMSAIVTNYGIDPSVDQWFISLLPTGSKATPLDMTVAYMSSQLAQLLATMLTSLMTYFEDGFAFMTRHGQMMQYSNDSLAQLEINLQGMLSPPTVA